MRKESVALSLCVIVGCNAAPERRSGEFATSPIITVAEPVEVSQVTAHPDATHQPSKQVIAKADAMQVSFEHGESDSSAQRIVEEPSVGLTDERLAEHLLSFRGDFEARDSGESGFVEPLSPADGIDTEVPHESAADAGGTGVALNLPSVLAAVGGQHPAVAVARWRVQQAYARLDSARVLWLPSIRAGFGFHRHDGNYQASNGEIVDVNRNSFQYGLGVAATGAGTTQQPGVVASFHFADAIFEPKVAERRAWAHGHAAGTTLNAQLLEAATAYTQLVAAHQLVAVVAAAKDRMKVLAKLTSDFAAAGEGLQADADRVQTELSLVDARLIESNGRAQIASARVAQSISMRSGDEIRPMDLNLVAIRWEDAGDDPSALIATGLSMRPELKESQALVAAACEAYKREKYRPFIPSVLLGFSTGGFGGGPGNNLDNVDDRYDFDAIMSWNLRNMGFGEHASRRDHMARIQQAKYEKVRRMDQVAREVSESFSTVSFREQQLKTVQHAVSTARDSYEQNLKRIRDGEGLPLEVLQSVQALEAAETAYVEAVAAHNVGQLRLQWAQGWPIHDVPGALASN